jgi:hypothetical protein
LFTKNSLTNVIKYDTIISEAIQTQSNIKQNREVNEMKLMSNGKRFTQGAGGEKTISEMTISMEEVMNAINGSELTADEKKTMAKEYVMGRMTAIEVMKAVVVTETVEITETAEVKEITKIRRAVVSLANKINSKIKDLSRAFKKAWAIIKGKTIQSKVAGVSFGNTQKALVKLTRYNPKEISVNLARENNEHDSNAVAVTVSVNNSKAYQIGFLPRELAQYIAKLMDSGIVLTSVFKGVTGGGDYTYGALIELKI